MLVQQPNNTLPLGITSVTQEENTHHKMHMDFSLIALNKEEKHEITSATKESAVLLLEGSVQITWGGRTESIHRESCFSSGPYALHVPKSTPIEILANRYSECILLQASNDVDFSPVFYTPDQCTEKVFGRGVLDDTSIRTVREVFSYTTAPYSQLVLGEVISHAGRWSSYPPHYHEQPEIYFFRFSKQQGFGAAYLGDEVFRSTHNSTLLIRGNLTHPQVCAPGYDMYYCWTIRNLGENYWKDRITADEHTWIDSLS